ncbi:hypothetical protein F4808DRAFT_236991 [Astrocystis sublimbata]|nr:hypothetical protein F4808DRAFT_236991 [Astrocystis sublimbata]
MSLRNSVGGARASAHVLTPVSTPRVPASVLSRVAAPELARDAHDITPFPTTSSSRQPAQTQTSLSPRTHRPARIWFNPTYPKLDHPIPESPRPTEPADERKVKLGKTLRIIQERLPTLLQSPLPLEILSPNISLHLFPTTHPYLPTVSGRVGYVTALWTSPIAWNRVPIVGNVRLEILSERMVSEPVHFSPRRTGAFGEQLVVKWRTASSNKTANEDASQAPAARDEHNLDAHIRGTQSPGEKKAFTGLFIFEFDKDGRVISHTIEHVDEHGDWEKGVGARVVGLTDWLLGGIKGRSGGLPALCAIESKRDRK